MNKVERDNYILNLIKNGIIKYKNNSQSIYYKWYDTLDKNKDGTDKYYFELSDLYKLKEINQLINCYIINSKKGIGKTYQMRLLMEEAEKQNQKFIFVRRLKEDLQEQQQDWDDLAEYEDWPYRIKSKKIMRRDNNKVVGRITTISTLYNQTGKEFKGYKYIFFDEFKDKRGIKRYIPKEFNKFVKFIIDVQRNKKDLKVFMFANDETRHDPYTTGLRIDASTDYFIDLEKGVFYVNLKEKFKGAITEDTAGYRLASGDAELMEELNNNETVYSEDENNITDYSKGVIEEIKYQFAWNKRLYVFGFNLKENIAIIKSIRTKQRNNSYHVYSMSSLDFIAFEDTIKPANIESMVKVWYNLLARKVLWFINYDDKLEIERLIEKVIGKIPRNQQLLK